MVAKRDQSPFNDDEIRAIAHAFMIALKRPKSPSSGSFSKTMKLDTSQVKDLRFEPKSKSLNRWVLAKGKSPSDISDRRLERPAPKMDPRTGAAGRHNAEDALKRAKIAMKRGSLEGDGRLERPAPRPVPEGLKQRGAAGSAPTQRVRKVKPKLKPRPRFNQGRHDA